MRSEKRDACTRMTTFVSNRLYSCLLACGSRLSSHSVCHALFCELFPPPLGHSEVAASAAQTTLQTPMQTQDFLVCFVNGKKHEIHARDFKPESTLLHFLRQGQNDQPANPCRHTSAAHCNVSTQGKAPSSERLNMHAPGDCRRARACVNRSSHLRLRLLCLAVLPISSQCAV